MTDGRNHNANSVTKAELDQNLRGGLYALNWEAEARRYAIPRAPLEEGYAQGGCGKTQLLYQFEGPGTYPMNSGQLLGCDLAAVDRAKTLLMTRGAEYGGRACKRRQDIKPCHPDHCPVHCSVSPWSLFGDCSKTCGGGTQSRSRSVVTPAAYGGAPCGTLTNTRPCNTSPCTCDPNTYTAWGSYSPCTVSCGGGGTQSRTLACRQRSGIVEVPPSEEAMAMTAEEPRALLAEERTQTGRRRRRPHRHCWHGWSLQRSRCTPLLSAISFLRQ